MSTATLLPPTTAAQSRAWRLGPARPLDAPCVACGAFDGLVYSAGDAYVCCLLCGWQRRLLTPQARLSAALAAIKQGSWLALLLDLQAQAPDALPPVAALLWRQAGPATWQGPSRTTPDTTYTVEYIGHRVKCDCPNLNTARCWHKLRARELGCVDLTAASDLWPD